jgi:hypothetical protein
MLLNPHRIFHLIGLYVTPTIDILSYAIGNEVPAISQQAMLLQTSQNNLGLTEEDALEAGPAAWTVTDQGRRLPVDAVADLNGDCKGVSYSICVQFTSAVFARAMRTTDPAGYRVPLV